MTTKKQARKTRTKEEVLAANVEFKASIESRLEALEKERDQLCDMLARNEAKMAAVTAIYDDLDKLDD